MFFLLFGSSGAGKTATIEALRERLPDLAIHDFDEIGVPPGADEAWRREGNELWVRRALEAQREGVDFLLAGQTPFAELQAAPSAALLESVSGCLLDCDDETRVARLRARGPEWLDRSAAELEDYVRWAAWLRDHAADPSRRIRIVDTSSDPVERVADEVAVWIEEVRSGR